MKERLKTLLIKLVSIKMIFGALPATILLILGYVENWQWCLFMASILGLREVSKAIKGNGA